MSTVVRMPSTRWRDAMQMNADGVLRKNLFNSVIIARDHPEMKGGLAYDEFRNVIVKKRKLPWTNETDDPWSDLDTLHFVDWVQGENLPMSDSLAEQAIQIVADGNKYHPVREWLESLQWDGVERVDHWLHDLMGVERSEDADDVFRDGIASVDSYVRQVGAKWMISAIARVMQPGCKADHILVLEGDQGIGKSTAVRALAGEDLFSDSLSDIKNKDAIMEIQGVWIVELAELDHLKKTESTAMKAWVTKTRDRCRPPYGKNIVEYHRQCIFVGTVNGSSYLKDDTGNRRYWPVKCGEVDVDEIKKTREQLWAEAFHRYLNGENWHLDDATVIETAKDQQRFRIETDPWQEELEEKLANLDSLSGIFLLKDAIRAIDPNIERWTKIHEMRIARCLVALGFTKRQARKGRANAKYWGDDARWENYVG